MIDIEPSRSGHPVLRKDGRYLASSLDPVREADLWLASCEEQIGDAPNIVVLGLGSGYHVRALLARFPQRNIVALEGDADVASAVARLMPDIPSETICFVGDGTRLFEHPRLRSAVHGVFRLLIHAPSCQAMPEYYQRIKMCLLARDRQGLELQLRARPELANVLDMRRLLTLPPAPISVKSVLSLLCAPKIARGDTAETGRNEREILFWRALGELVK